MAQFYKLKPYIIVAVIIVVGGFMYYLGVIQSGNTNNTNANTNSVKMTNNQEDEYKIAYLDNEVIFTNYIYNYQISLPKDWLIDEIDDLSRTAFFDPVASQQELVSELLQGMKMEVYVFEVQDEITLEEIVNQDLSGMLIEEIPEQKEIAVDGEPAIKVKMDVLGFSVTTYVLKEDYYYTIVGYIGDLSDKERYEAQYSSILSTFEFLD